MKRKRTLETEREAFETEEPWNGNKLQSLGTERQVFEPGGLEMESAGLKQRAVSGKRRLQTEEKTWNGRAMERREKILNARDIQRRLQREEPCIGKKRCKTE